MGFKLNTNRIVTREIPVQQPVDGGEGYTTAKLTAKLRILSESQKLELNDLPPRDLVDRVLIGVEGVGDAEGNLMTADEALAAVKDDTACVSAIAAYYIDMTQVRNFRLQSRK